MYNYKIIYFIIILNFISLQAADVSGTIDGETWTAENSPYNVVGNITVLDLIIEPGVEVLFNGNFSFFVNGTLNATGSQVDSIFFKPAAGNSIGWQGIVFNSGLAEHEMDHCSVSGSSTNGIIINSDNVIITRTSSRNHAGSGLYVNNQTVNVTKCTFNHNSSYGINLISNANVTLYAVKVSYNGSYGINAPTGSVAAYNCIIDHNNGYGLYKNTGSYTLENVVVANNTSHGLVSLGGTINILNSIFYYNEEEPSIFASGGTVLTTYSNIERGFTGAGNINVSNAFIDQNYNLRDTSSCIDGGNPYPQYYDKYYPPSKGGEYNDMGAYGGLNARKWFSPLSTEPILIDYDSVNYDESATKLVTIKNYHDSSIEIDSISIVGIDKSKFEITNLPGSFPIILNIDESLQLSVRFSPGDKGDFSANLRCYSEIENQTIDLTGNGVRPNIIINPQVNDYGEINVGDSSRFSFVILNSSYGILKVPSIEGPSHDVFKADFIPFELGFMESESLSVIFNPITADTLNDSLFILSNDPDDSRLKISLSGIGLAPEIASVQDDIDFGRRDVFSDTSTSLIISNSGNKDLSISNAFLSGTGQAHFNLRTEIDSDTLLVPHETMDFKIEFLPNARALLTSTLNIVSNDPNTDTLKILIKGRGVAADLSVSPFPIDFGNVLKLQNAQKEVVIENSGERPLDVYTFYLENGEESEFTLITDSTAFNNIDSSESRSIQIGIDAETEGTFSDQLIIVSNDYLEDTIRVDISARVVTPGISYGDDEIDFGDIWRGESVNISKVILNNGTATLKIENVHLTGTENGNFVLESEIDSLLIEQGESDSIIIRYIPKELGTDEAQLEFTTNVIDSMDIAINLKGRGIAAYISSNPDILDFGSVKTSSSKTRSFVISNTGNADLEIAEFLIENDRYNAFQIDMPPIPLIIAPGVESDSIDVKFEPINRLKSKAVLNVISNAYQQDSLKLELAATGIVAGVPYLYLFDDSVHHIGNAVITGDSLFPLVIENLSDDTELKIDSIAISETGSSAFAVESNDLPFTIEPLSSSNQLKLIFSPTELRTYTCTLIIFSNDTIDSPHEYTIYANGIMDETPPEVRLDSLATQLSLDTNGKFQTRIRDQESTISEAVLYIRKTSVNDFDSLALTSGDQVIWSADLNSDIITEYGLEYYLRIEHGGRESYYPAAYKTIPAALSIQIPQYGFPQQTLANDYQMISVPFNSKGQTLKELFGDELGTYDNTKYRIFDWDPTDTVFVEQKDMNTKLPPGKALYLITKKSKQLNINDCQTVLSGEAFTIDLKKGWNMIGIPYAFNVLWSDIHPSTNGMDLKFWDGTQMIYPKILEPFKGYGFYADRDTAIVVPAVEAAISKLAKPDQDSDESEWYFQIEAQRGRYADRFNFAGVRNSSNDKLDRWDSYEAPGIGDHISLYFTEKIENNKSVKLCANYKYKNNTHYQYDFEYKSTISGKTLLNLIPKNLPDTYDWGVIAREGNILLPKGKISSFQKNKQYRLIVGNRDYLNSIKSEFKILPEKFSVSQNYPNPFNPVTNITIAVPKEAYITADIYNILGERVKRIANNILISEGYHDFSWDGKNEHNFLVSSGIYFFTFRTSNYVKTIKMILQR
ncbi:MAG: choice-of-anchor D domain-containing protein [Calditrichaceae bacterium]|nr:choice-of-anchor D domain-containing protein [Calditrichaceae bacterium]